MSIQRLGEAEARRRRRPGIGGGATVPGRPKAPASTGQAKAPGKPKFNPMGVLKGLSTSGLLSPKQLNAAARALTVLETRPEIHGYKQITTELQKEKAREAGGLETLGRRTAGETADTYRNIAQSEADSLAHQQALGSKLTQQSGAIAAQSAQSLAGTQTNALGDLTSQLQQRGSPQGGSAQEALAQAVASQQAAQNTNSQAAQQFASSQAANFGSLGAAMAQATQMQGGQAIGGIARTTVGRIGESNAKYNQGIRETMGKLAEAKGSYGSKFTKNLLGLREGEQKYQLGQEAVRGDKESLAAQVASDKASNEVARENAKSSRISAQASALNASINQYEAEHPNASNSDIKEKRQEVKQEVREVRSMLPSLLVEAGRPPKNKQELNALIGLANTKAGADPALVRKILVNWWKAKHQGNRGEKGKTKVPYAP